MQVDAAAQLRSSLDDVLSQPVHRLHADSTRRLTQHDASSGSSLDAQASEAAAATVSPSLMNAIMAEVEVQLAARAKYCRCAAVRPVHRGAVECILWPMLGWLVC